MKSPAVKPPAKDDAGTSKSLRSRAEDHLKTEGEKTGLSGTETDQRALLHELQVHQVELEMQNEELQRIQRESERQAEKYIDLYDFAPVGYFTIDAIGTILEANLTGSVLLGTDRQSLIGVRLGTFLKPDSLPSFNAFCKRVFLSGMKEICDVELSGVSGKPSWYAHIEGRAELEGQVGGWIWLVLTDITQSKRAEMAFQKSLETFKTVMDSLDTFVYVADMKTYEVLFVNRYGKTIRGDITGTTCWRSLHDDQTGPCPFCSDENVLDSAGNPMGIITRQFQDPATKRWYECHDSAIPWIDGRLVRLEITADITEHKQVEEALRQTNRQLNLLSGITRHDILNKITVILGYLGIAETKPLDPEIAGYLGKMKAATDAIRSQIEFTRIYQDLGSHEPQWQKLSLVLSLLRVPETIALHADVTGVEVYADPMLEKVFFNLLDNAIRHGEHVTEVRVSSSPSGEELRIVWEDDGAGIPDAEKEQIFRRGYGKNTGLGLFLVREILSLTGITITEAGTAGKGARFEIAIPKGAYRTTVLAKGGGSE